MKSKFLKQVTIKQTIMKKYLKISNSGLLDIRLIALMGGTTKSNSSYKIGQFGSGLKYSLAYLLRKGVDFKVYIGQDEVSIECKSETINENEFNIIYINGEKTSITTQMGLDWKPWMIVRELYSNALDEGGATYDIVSAFGGDTDKTSFYLELNADFLEVYNNWSKYFLIGKESFYEDKNVKIYPQSGELRVYKQGILIHSSSKESLFNYDFKSAPLNELREYKGFLEQDISRSLMQLSDPDVIRYFVENILDDHYEATVDYDYNWAHSFSKTWEDTLSGCKIIHKKALENLEARGISVDTTKNIVVPESLYKGLSKKFESIGALQASKSVNDFYEIYNESLHDRIHKSLKILEKVGYYIEPELTFIYGVFGDKCVMAKVDIEKKKIYMSEKHIDKDLFSICTTIIEENEHYKTGFFDETRAFQQHFINLYTKELIGDSVTVI